MPRDGRRPHKRHHHRRHSDDCKDQCDRHERHERHEHHDHKPHKVCSLKVDKDLTVCGNTRLVGDLTVGGTVQSDKKWLLSETRFSTEIVNNDPARTLLCWNQAIGPLAGFDRSDGSFTAPETGLYEINFNTRAFNLTFDLTDGQFVPNQPGQQTPGNRYILLEYTGGNVTLEGPIYGQWAHVDFIPDSRFEAEKNGIVYISVTAQIPMTAGDKVTPRYFAEYDVDPAVSSPPPELRVTPYAVGLMTVCQLSAQSITPPPPLTASLAAVAPNQQNGEGLLNPL